jgi:sialic acid synthase SpsE
MSTGVSDLSDIDESVRVLRGAGCQELILLKCTSTYPSSPENTNLNTLPHLQQLFGCIVGLSDHTMGIGAAIASVALGSRVIEKHFTLSRNDGGVDSAFSLEPAELKSLVVESERAFLSLGKIQYGIQKAETKSKFFKRSLYIAKDIQQGEIITRDHIKIIRPGLGLAPKHLDSVIGRRAAQSIKAGTPVTNDLM